MGVIVITILTILSNVGGLGGGGLMSPFLMIFFRLSLVECIPIGNFMGVLSAFSRFIINFKLKIEFFYSITLFHHHPYSP